MVPLPASPWPTQANNAKLSYRFHFLFPMVALRMKATLPFDFKNMDAATQEIDRKWSSLFFLLFHASPRSAHTHTKHTHAEPLLHVRFLFLPNQFFIWFDERTDGPIAACTLTARMRSYATYTYTYVCTCACVHEHVCVCVCVRVCSVITFICKVHSFITWIFWGGFFYCRFCCCHCCCCSRAFANALLVLQTAFIESIRSDAYSAGSSFRLQKSMTAQFKTKQIKMVFLCHTQYTHTHRHRHMENAFETQLCDDHICGLDDCVVVSGLLAGDERMPLIRAQLRTMERKKRISYNHFYLFVLLFCHYYWNYCCYCYYAVRVLLFDKNAKEVVNWALRLYFYWQMQIHIEWNENARNKNSADIDEQLQ